MMQVLFRLHIYDILIQNIHNFLSRDTRPNTSAVDVIDKTNLLTVDLVQSGAEHCESNQNHINVFQKLHITKYQNNKFNVNEKTFLNDLINNKNVKPKAMSRTEVLMFFVTAGNVILNTKRPVWLCMVFPEWGGGNSERNEECILVLVKILLNYKTVDDSRYEHLLKIQAPWLFAFESTVLEDLLRPWSSLSILIYSKDNRI
ncbi:hypothetical protein AGLY_016134 [Aphis glycines]|uniref:Uncharacterized protein n=1 Tax=Aphis glycines TaxID=307491 RepID=A0A6G0SZA0_APHGL|nr:hypothetical protein AGLY_016134 [Aphis glycines]